MKLSKAQVNFMRQFGRQGIAIMETAAGIEPAAIADAFFQHKRVAELSREEWLDLKIRGFRAGLKLTPFGRAALKEAEDA